MDSNYTGPINDAIVDAWRSVWSLAHGSTTVVHELDHAQQFAAALDRQIVEPDVLALFRSYIRGTTEQFPLDYWIPKFREVGFRATFGEHTVMTDLPSEPMVLWRLADDYRAGLSWAADPRMCMSFPWAKGTINTMHLWCAVVPPEALLGIAWYNLGVQYGRPLWRTIDSDLFGRVQITLDDFGEYLVDPAALVDARVVKWDTFTRPGPVKRRRGQSVGLGHVAAAVIG